MNQKNLHNKFGFITVIFFNIVGYVKGGKTINTEVFPDTVDNVPGKSVE